VPKLWTETIEAHRREVRDAILESAVSLAEARGPLSVTMSQSAEYTGIGRATLYKYFSDVESILRAWHERQITAHLEYLAEVRDQTSGDGERLSAVLEAYALIARESHEHGDSELAALLHKDEQVVQAEHHLRGMIRDLVAKAARAGAVRTDISPTELTDYCLHALTASRNLRSRAAVARLVRVTLAGLRPEG
jgi:AcrR family transcriptional regulator